MSSVYYYNVLNAVCMPLIKYALGHTCYLRIYSKYSTIISPKWKFLWKKLITFFSRTVVNWSTLSSRLYPFYNSLLLIPKKHRQHPFLSNGPSLSLTTPSLVIKNMKIHLDVFFSPWSLKLHDTEQLSILEDGKLTASDIIFFSWEQTRTNWFCL